MVGPLSPLRQGNQKLVPQGEVRKAEMLDVRSNTFTPKRESAGCFFLEYIESDAVLGVESLQDSRCNRSNLPSDFIAPGLISFKGLEISQFASGFLISGTDLVFLMSQSLYFPLPLFYCSHAYIFKCEKQNNKEI